MDNRRSAFLLATGVFLWLSLVSAPNSLCRADESEVIPSTPSDNESDQSAESASEVSLAALAALQESASEVLAASLIASSRHDAQAHLQDPAFAHYVNMSLVTSAWASLDPNLFIDVGLQFAEAERVLMRHHRLLNSEMFFELALRSAVDRKDLEALKRLALVAEARQNDALRSEIDSMQQLSAGARDLVMLSRVPQGELSEEDLERVADAITQMRRASILGDPEALQEAIDTAKAIEAVSQEQRERIDEIAAELTSVTPEAELIEQQKKDLLDTITSGTRQFGTPRFQPDRYAIDRFNTGVNSGKTEAGRFSEGFRKGLGIRPNVEIIDRSRPPRKHYFSVRNDTSRTVTYILPSGRQYRLAPDFSVRHYYTSQTKRNGLRVISPERRNYRLASRNFAFWEKNGQLKFGPTSR
jgi:hypothetical protein